MKLTDIAFILFPLATLANPIATPENSLNPDMEVTKRLEVRANRCYLNSDALPSQGCDYDPCNGRRKRTVTGADRFDVSYTATGRDFRGYRKWDYVPSWDCWIWAGWTQEGCESGLPSHSPGC